MLCDCLFHKETPTSHSRYSCLFFITNAAVHNSCYILVQFFRWISMEVTSNFGNWQYIRNRIQAFRCLLQLCQPLTWFKFENRLAADWMHCWFASLFLDLGCTSGKDFHRICRFRRPCWEIHRFRIPCLHELHPIIHHFWHLSIVKTTDYSPDSIVQIRLLFSIQYS